MDEPPSPKRKWVLTAESFEGMLLWLNRDRNEAGKKYEEIRAALIKRFRQLGILEPEELTNQTFDRVAKKLPEIISVYVGPPDPYFFSIALYVYKEHLRKPILMSLANSDFPQPERLNPEEVFEKELLDSCLQHCMDQLHESSRDMIMEYYYGERQKKIRRRKELAEQLGIKLTVLRLRAQRVRSALKKCILECMERKGVEREIM